MLTQFVEREMEEIELKDVLDADLMHRILSSIYGSVDVVLTSANVQVLLLLLLPFVDRRMSRGMIRPSRWASDHLSKNRVYWVPEAVF
jgi:hypothetical protein